MAKTKIISMEILQQWLSFVNNNPTCSQKLLLIIFGCG